MQFQGSQFSPDMFNQGLFQPNQGYPNQMQQNQNQMQPMNYQFPGNMQQDQSFMNQNQPFMNQLHSNQQGNLQGQQMQFKPQPVNQSNFFPGNQPNIPRINGENNNEQIENDEKNQSSIFQPQINQQVQEQKKASEDQKKQFQEEKTENQQSTEMILHATPEISDNNMDTYTLDLPNVNARAVDIPNTNFRKPPQFGNDQMQIQQQNFQNQRYQNQSQQNQIVERNPGRFASIQPLPKMQTFVSLTKLRNNYIGEKTGLPHHYIYENSHFDINNVIVNFDKPFIPEKDGKPTNDKYYNLVYKVQKPNGTIQNTRLFFKTNEILLTNTFGCTASPDNKKELEKKSQKPSSIAIPLDDCPNLLKYLLELNAFAKDQLKYIDIEHERKMHECQLLRQRTDLSTEAMLEEIKSLGIFKYWDAVKTGGVVQGKKDKTKKYEFPSRVAVKIKNKQNSPGINVNCYTYQNVPKPIGVEDGDAEKIDSSEVRTYDDIEYFITKGFTIVCEFCLPNIAAFGGLSGWKLNFALTAIYLKCDATGQPLGSVLNSGEINEKNKELKEGNDSNNFILASKNLILGETFTPGSNSFAPNQNNNSMFAPRPREEQTQTF